MATSVGMESKGSQPDLEYGHQNHADADPRDDEEKLAANRPYLWTSAKADFDDGKPCEFLGFEPCYTACIKDLEWQILRKIQTLKPAHDNTNLTQEMAPILIQYCTLTTLISLSRHSRGSQSTSSPINRSSPTHPLNSTHSRHDLLHRDHQQIRN